MRYWDASAIVPLLVLEDSTPAMLSLLAQEDAMVTWWGTRLECASALARLERGGTSVSSARDRLEAFAAFWAEVEATEAVRRVAMRLLRVHALRAADALQLAAAVVWSEGASGLTFVTLDDRLASAADREGFRIAGSADPSPPGPSLSGR